MGLKFKSIFFFIFLISCAKDEIIFIPDQRYLINNEELLSRFIDTPKIYTLNLTDQTYSFVSPSNIIVRIPALSLRDNTGNVVTGNVDMQLSEASLSKKNLLGSPSAVYLNGLLDCKSVIFISFSKNNIPLSIGIPIEIYVPSNQESSDNRFEVFESTAYRDDKKWAKKDWGTTTVSSTKYNVQYADSNISLTGFKLEVRDDVKWICVANHLKEDTEAVSDICVSADRSFSVKNSLVFMVFDNINTVIRLQGKEFLSEFCAENIYLSGSYKGKLFIISDFGKGNYYFGMTNADIKSGQKVELLPTAKSIEDIKAILNKL